ncbi:hypothetical protein BDV59DRAFT_201234 [Aspergillus ambiguus]|uniref:uncharacterized protein n=1 Tax=Aspergillus ambiguus TaxID=176160 RepID=UPI003CCCE6B4
MDVDPYDSIINAKHPLEEHLCSHVNLSPTTSKITLQTQLHDKPLDTVIFTDDLLVASPYTDPAHLLDYATLDRSSQMLARALTILQPTRDDYATACYLDSFNWADVIDSVRRLCQEARYSWTRRSFYVIVFRSRVQPAVDSAYLYELDVQSHREAMASGGLLKYWFGTTNASRENLATCIWRSRRDAQLGGTGPWHRRARMAIDQFYERISLTRLKLEIEDDVKTWGISEWEDETTEGE